VALYFKMVTKGDSLFVPRYSVEPLEEHFRSHRCNIYLLGPGSEFVGGSCFEIFGNYLDIFGGVSSVIDIPPINTSRGKVEVDGLYLRMPFDAQGNFTPGELTYFPESLRKDGPSTVYVQNGGIIPLRLNPYPVQDVVSRNGRDELRLFTCWLEENEGNRRGDFDDSIALARAREVF